jgi:cytochrome bd ubiquinol oxidase subunit II
MRLSDRWMVFVILAFTMYIVLDGYDLGIGALTLIERDDSRRRQIHELVAWAWDGNESWLVLVALTLWSGVPLVTGVALPALYIPLMLMLFSLIVRGVSLELVGQYSGWHPVWGRAFSCGSLLAGFCQGAAFGGVVAGLPVRGSRFVGGPFTFLHNGYSALTGLTAVALYLLAGCAWVYFRTDGEIQRRAAQTGRVAVVAVAAGTAASWALAPVAGTLKLDVGSPSRLPIWIVGAALLAVSLAGTYRSLSTLRPERRDWAAVFTTLGIYAGGLLLAGGLLYPTLVPPAITVHEAASPNSSLLFLVIGAGIFIPVIFTYQGFSYWVFRGKLAANRGAPNS